MNTSEVDPSTSSLASNPAPLDAPVGHPVAEKQRIESLDVLRGFALLGILLLNILGFGLVAASYSNPGVDVALDQPVQVAVWASVELFAEGAMRGLFSLLFGAGVVLFTQVGRRGALHYKRTFWLLAFGLFDAYVLLWNGDILVTYALAGALLYWLRNFRARTLLVIATVLLLAVSGFYGVVGMGLSGARAAAEQVAEAEAPEDLGAGVHQAAEVWDDFALDFAPTQEQIADELAARRESYRAAAEWNLKKTNEMIFFVIPVFLLADALVVMIVGMALFKLGVLQGRRSQKFYWQLAAVGFAIGLSINTYEVTRTIRAEFDLLAVFAQAQPTYHLGRLAMALGYVGLVVGLAKLEIWRRLRSMLASVGRMALTNYLFHSVVALFVFTGAGFSMVGKLSRAELYPIVLVIWLVQLVLSEWWMRRFVMGPVEWFWRFLTYGKRPPFRRV